MSTKECMTLDSSEEQEISITTNEYNELLDIQQTILNMISLKGNTKNILSELCKLAENLLPNSVASIMMLNKKTGLMSVISAPSIPEHGHKALENLKPGSGGGSCGNAVFHNEAQFVVDTFTDNRWSDVRQIAVDFNLCSCWSMPIKDENANAIGSFALSSFEHRLPSSFHKKLLHSAALMVSILLKNKSINQQIKFMTFHDSLTNLYNKTYLEKILRKNKKNILLLVNINNFSYINTAYGFEIGDKLLKEVAIELKENFNAKTICRINADEFALIYNKEVDIVKIILDIQNYFYNLILNIENIILNISFNYGVACSKKDVLKNAALALKQSKENGKNHYYIFDKNSDAINSAQRQEFIASNNLLRDALNEDRVVPYFQAIHNNTTNTITKYEALVRILKDGEVISPYKFLKPAKLSGLLTKITKVMIDKCFKIMAPLKYDFSINITEDDLNRNYLSNYLSEAAIKYKIDVKRVTLEILEGVSSTGKKNHIKQLSEIKALGFNLAIDDFGAEYSNFERILDLDIDFIKIDSKYIKDIDTNKKSYEITRAIAFFAHNANIICIAEFVHSQSVQDIVNKLGINYSQGYFFAEPRAEVI
ncbi:MAG: diguanylate cyclase [Sulfurimonas sp.]|nr:MAG: diguanylate cyclase [Sulfurimonas sp.]